MPNDHEVRRGNISQQWNEQKWHLMLGRGRPGSKDAVKTAGLGDQNHEQQMTWTSRLVVEDVADNTPCKLISLGNIMSLRRLETKDNRPSREQD